MNPLKWTVMLGLWLLLGLFVPAAGETLKDDAQLRSSDVSVPSTIRSGRKYDVRVQVKNVGTTTWEARKYFLKIKIVRGPSGSSTQREELAPLVELKSNVAPNESHTFYYEIEGPRYLGEYRLQWVMSEGRDEFGDDVEKTVRVTE